jgi:hypothetical protein
MKSGRASESNAARAGPWRAPGRQTKVLTWYCDLAGQSGLISTPSRGCQ